MVESVVPVAAFVEVYYTPLNFVRPCVPLFFPKEISPQSSGFSVVTGIMSLSQDSDGNSPVSSDAQRMAAGMYSGSFVDGECAEALRATGHDAKGLSGSGDLHHRTSNDSKMNRDVMQIEVLIEQAEDLHPQRTEYLHGKRLFLAFLGWLMTEFMGGMVRSMSFEFWL